DAFDLALAENAIRREHKSDDHQDVGRKVLGAAANVGVEVARSEALDDADDQPADDRADDRIESAEDHHRKYLETDQGKLHVDPEHVAPNHAADRRDHAGHRPGQREIAFDVDTHRHCDLLIVGNGAHGN